MQLNDLGEFGLIEILKNKLKSGIGDDCAVLPYSKTHFLLFTTDIAIEDVHFVRKKLNWEKLGQKVMTANISDIAAMGGWPTYAVVSLGLPKNLKTEKLKNLYRGMLNIASRHNVEIVGGDLSAADKITINIALLGLVEKKNVIRRSGARVGDLICITRNHPAPQVKEGRMLAKSRLATAMIDNSDGLVRSIIEICRESKTGAEIWYDMLPAPKEDTLYKGEIYNLVFTIKSKNQFYVIGRVTKQRGKVTLRDKKGKELKLKSTGYEHFG